jgi:hypothetical protein
LVDINSLAFAAPAFDAWRGVGVDGARTLDLPFDLLTEFLRVASETIGLLAKTFQKSDPIVVAVHNQQFKSVFGLQNVSS